ncbi:MAG: 30S ribosomal protein S8 [Candidatus Kerfeldbacteria bacterium]
MTDPISDMLTRIRNSQDAHKSEVLIPYSKMKHQLADILAEEGYIVSAEKEDGIGRPQIKVVLKYAVNEPAIQTIRRVSKPGRRVYVGAKKLPYVFDNLGIAIISTSQGLMTNNKARGEKLGGEVICEVF